MKNLEVLLLFIKKNYSSQVLKEKKELLKNKSDFHKNKIKDVFVDGNQIYFSILKDQKLNANDGHDRTFILKNIDGVEFNLRMNEIPIGVANNKLCTFFYAGQYGGDLIIYEIEQSKLVKKSLLELSTSCFAEILESGLVVVSDGGHCGSDYIALYSDNLELIHRFVPFTNVFDAAYGSNENYIVFIGKKRSDPTIKIALYGASGKDGLVGSSEVIIEPNYLIAATEVVGKNIVILLSNAKDGSSKILLIDDKLNLIKNQNIPYGVSQHKIVESKFKFYVNTFYAIYAFDIESGNLVDVIKKEYDKAIRTKYGYRFTGSELFALKQNKLLLLEATYEDKEENINDVVIKIIETTTTYLLQSITSDKLFKENLNLKPFSDGVILFSNKDVLFFEND